MGIWIAVAVGVAVVLVAAWIWDRRARRHGHRLRRGSSIWRDEVREHRRDIRAADSQRFMNRDRSWTRDRRR
jgi:hypothetical protein